MTDLLIVNGALGAPGSSIAAISLRRARETRVAPPSLRLPSIGVPGNPIPAALAAILENQA